MKKEHNEIISISDFKARCLQLLQATGDSGKEYTIIKKGIPLARVVPIKKKQNKSLRDSLKGLAKINGDIIHSDWSSDFEVTTSS